MTEVGLQSALPPTTAIEPSGRPLGRTVKHYPDLDFLRGVAAIAVMLFHFGERTKLPRLMPHGYLAVDLFFVMSGFVLSHAYGARLANRTLRLSRFVLLWILRFLPMISLGTILAAVIELGRPHGLSSRHLLDTLDALLRGCLLIPTFRQTTLEGTLYPLNGPAWTLFFELLASLGFALAIVLRMPRALVGLLACASAVWLGYVLTRDGSLQSTGAFPLTFLDGFPRVALSVAVGVGLHRLELPRPAIDRRVLAALVLLVCMMPNLSGSYDALFNAAAVLVVFPLIVLCSTSAPPQQREAFLVRWSGLISFPLYAIHYPIVRAIGFLLLRSDHALALRLAVVTVSSLATIGLAALCEIFFDKPLRGRLRRFVRQ